MTNEPPKAEVDMEAERSWDIAEQIAQSFGPLPALFTAAIRAVRAAPAILHSGDAHKIQKFAVDAVNFPVRISPTFKTALYFLADELIPDTLARDGPLTYVRLLEALAPEQLIAAIALTYVQRRVRRRCESDEWTLLSSRLRTHMLIGHLVGERIRGVGGGNGMALAGLRYLAHALFLLNDAKGFRDVRRAGERHGQLFDLNAEQARWGCTHMQVASYLVSELGYGMGPRLAFGMFERAMPTGKSAPPDEVNREMLGWSLTLRCVESLHARGTSSGMLSTHAGSLVGSGGAAELERRALAVVAQGKGFEWIERSPKELPPEISTSLGIQPHEEALAEKEFE